MTYARVYRKPSEQQHDRLPVSTYEEAVSRLVCELVKAGSEPALTEDYIIPPMVALVADIFWLSDARVLRDVRAALRKIGG